MESCQPIKRLKDKKKTITCMPQEQHNYIQTRCLYNTNKGCQIDVYSMFVLDKPVRISSFLGIKFQVIWLPFFLYFHSWYLLTLILLTWRIWWAPNNASKWQMGFDFDVWRIKGQNLLAFRITKHCRNESLSPWHGASSACGCRNGLKYGG
jgi:hypothetical protein